MKDPAPSTPRLLTFADVRALAAAVGMRPRKMRGQNFVADPNTIRRLVRLAAVREGDVVLEVGPGFGSLTLGLLDAGAHVVAVEIEPALSAALPQTVRRFRPQRAGQLTVVTADALRLPALAASPTRLVANLPYNVAVPVLLHVLEALLQMRDGLVLVQAEVADRLVAAPGSRVYGVPSVKLRWYAQARRVGTVPRAVFWPQPHVDSALVAFTRHPEASAGGLRLGDRPAPRAAVFEVIDAAFSSRRKTMRAALAGWAGSAARAEATLHAAGVDPAARAEQLELSAFVRIAATPNLTAP